TLTQEDEDGYRRAAHSIKSNAQTFGATALAAQARDIELSGTFDTAAVAKLQATLDATALALEGLLHD
ncbi:MAG: Hpt domain-containing protein, partial [Rhizobiaceae bacterium]